MIPLWTIPMATVTGNTLIVKPSERDPGAAMIIAELCERAGLPPGVVNVVHGTVPTVNAICDHPKIKAISFVGGNKAGQHIYERYLLNYYFVSTHQINISTSAEQRTASEFKPTSGPKIMPLLCLTVGRFH